jgi:ABC-type transport system involved in multi-copper enzyme maturation permease subunit
MSGESHWLLEDRQSWLDRIATWIADRSSPILVKESRQALKSWHFQWTFLLLLLAVVAWSILGVASLLSQEFQSAGTVLFSGYSWILGFPLAVVIPLATFRSLAREFENETIQLLSITTLSARRIILGKLGSAMVQMIVYMSAVVPCIAFAYLLRGIDLSTIFYVLFLAVVGCLSLSCVGLMFAGLARTGWLISGTNLFLGMGTLFVYFMWCSFFGFVADVNMPPEGEMVILVIALAIASTGYLCFEVAVSLIGFVSDDRSSKVRLAVSFQSLVFTMVFFGVLFSVPSSFLDVTPFAYFSIVLTHYWVFIGAMMVSESPGLSNRVRRKLPGSRIGQAGWGLLIPGPGRGYLYALTAIVGWNLVLAVALLFRIFRWIGVGFDESEMVATYHGIAINIAFGVFILSLTYLIMLIRQRPGLRIRPLIGLLIAGLIYALTSIVSTIAEAIRYSNFGYYSSGNGYAARFNWIWAFVETLENTAFQGRMVEVTLFQLALAGGLALICCYHACGELRARPIAVPQRVRDSGHDKEAQPLAAPSAAEG